MLSTTKRYIMNKFTYDPASDMAYISLAEYVRVEYSIERTCLIDVDEGGYIVGIEIFNFANPQSIVEGVRNE